MLNTKALSSLAERATVHSVKHASTYKRVNYIQRNNLPVDQSDSWKCHYYYPQVSQTAFMYRAQHELLSLPYIGVPSVPPSPKFFPISSPPFLPASGAKVRSGRRNNNFPEKKGRRKNVGAQAQEEKQRVYTSVRARRCSRSSALATTHC